MKFEWNLLIYHVQIYFVQIYFVQIWMEFIDLLCPKFNFFKLS